jgi:hypothetical protein
MDSNCQNDMGALVKALGIQDVIMAIPANKTVEIDGVRYVSVIKLIECAGDGQGRSKWHYIKAKFPELESQVKYHKFAGRGPFETPVVDAKNALEILMVLTGRKAVALRYAAADVLLKSLNPTQEHISDLFEQQRVVRQCSQPTFFHVAPSQICDYRQQFPDTDLYVRVQLPPDYTDPACRSGKQLTTNVIKFGITNCIRNRTAAYQREHDNGYMMYRFSCDCRKHASIVESMLREDLAHATVYNSFEYVDCAMLAEYLDTDFVNESYEFYIRLASKLFAYMVRRVRFLWPKKYVQHFGYAYEVKEIPCLSSCDEADVVVDKNNGKVQLAFPRKEITAEMALDLDLCDPDYKSMLKATQERLQVTQERLQASLVINAATPPPQAALSIHTIGPAVERTPSIQDADDVTPPPPLGDRRSKGIVISRDVLTGDETTYDSVERASRACGTAAITMRRTYLDKPRQLKGRHWRTAAKPYWVPPQGLRYDPVQTIKHTDGYVKATSDQETYIYESKTVAAAYVGVDVNTISYHLKRGTPCQGFMWSDLAEHEVGTWSTASQPSPSQLFPMDRPNSGANGRCKGKIIARDLSTGAETIYSSVSDAALRDNNPCAHSLEKSFIDKPRQANGKHFRSFDAGRYWQVPTCLRYDASTFVTKTDGYVICTDVDGSNVCMYESMNAARLDGYDRASVAQHIKSGKPYRNKLWRKAREDEYDTFVTCEPAGGSDINTT